MRPKYVFLLISLFVLASYCKVNAQDYQIRKDPSTNTPLEKDLKKAQSFILELPRFTSKLSKVNLNALKELEILESSIQAKISQEKAELQGELMSEFRLLSDFKSKLESVDVLNEFSRKAYVGKLDSVFTLFAFSTQNFSFDPSQLDLMRGNMDQLNKVLKRSEAINSFIKSRISKLSALSVKYDIKCKIPSNDPPLFCGKLPRLFIGK